MSRVRLLMSATTDLDADAHVHWLTTRGPADPEDVVTAEWPLIARAALRLRRRPREADDLLITVGAAAFLAASLGWRGRHVHLPVGAPSRPECFQLRRRPGVRVVVSSVAASRLLVTRGVSPARIERVVPPVGDVAPTRAEARRRLRLADDAVVVALPGTIRPGSGHRLAIWAASLLAHRDPTWRFLIGTRGDDERARAFVAAMAQEGEDGAYLHFREGDEPNAMAAADIAIFAGDGVPETSMLDAALRHGTAIVAPRATDEREGLAGAYTFEPSKPRLMAKASLLAADALGAARPAASLASERTWDGVLTSA